MQRVLKSHQLIYYGLPGLPLAMLGLPLFVYLPTYYSEGLGLSLTAVGLALLIARSLDVLTDPLIGILNDHLPTGNWRRKSFIVAGAPLLLIGLNFLLKPADDVGAVYLFCWSFITYLGWTLINIPWLAWGAEISPDYHEKSALASSREVFAVIGTITVISLPVLLSIESDLGITLGLLAKVVTFLLPLTLVPLLWKLSDRTANQPLKEQPISKKVNWKQLGLIKGNSAVKRLLPAYFINSFANALPATLFILFVTHVLKMPEQSGLLLVCYFLAAIAGLPLWLYIARKTDKHRSWSVALIIAICSFIWVPLLGEGDFYAFLAICLISGFALGADVVLPASIQADIAQDMNNEKVQNLSQGDDYCQDATGLLFGLWGLLTKLALALAVGVAFPLLDSVGLNFDAPSKLAITTLAILYALLPVILKFWVVIQMWHFPFDQKYFSRNLEHYNKGNNNENNNTTPVIGNFSANPSYKRL